MKWLIKILAKVYLANPHSPFEGWFTLFTLPFTLFEGWITLLEGWMSLAKEDSPFKKGERIHPWGWITLKKGESPSKRVNHPFEGWIFDKGDLKKGDWRVNHPFQGWMKKVESQVSKMNFKNRFLYEVFNYRQNITIK